MLLSVNLTVISRIAKGWTRTNQSSISVMPLYFPYLEIGYLQFSWSLRSDLETSMYCIEFVTYLNSRNARTSRLKTNIPNVNAAYRSGFKTKRTNYARKEVFDVTAFTLTLSETGLAFILNLSQNVSFIFVKQLQSTSKTEHDGSSSCPPRLDCKRCSF
jgi:hypothetical protein